MNIPKMFELRKEHDQRIEEGQQGKDLLPDKIANLIESVGKVLGAWRGHHYWSETHEPDGALVDCDWCQGRGFYFDGQRVKCQKCRETGKVFSPLLEAYVEAMARFFSVANEIDLKDDDLFTYDNLLEGETAYVTIEMMHHIGAVRLCRNKKQTFNDSRQHWRVAWYMFVNLGDKNLNLAEDQIETAFYAHHKEMMTA